MASIELTVAYPGREGAHSAAACDRLFPAARLVPLPTFSDVVDAVASGRVPYGVLPIESSLVGPVAETHDLLYESPLSIVAEAIMPVNHCLVGPGVVELADVREIHSHPGRARPVPQAPRLAAARDRGRRADDGDAASIVAGLADPAVVAIASDRAARHQRAHDHRRRTSATIPRRTPGSSRSPRTRGSTGATAQWRTAFSFTTDHRPGALLHALEPLARHGIDLNLLVSRPIPSRPFSYRFDAVLGGHPLDPEISSTLGRCAALTAQLRVFGSYRADREGGVTAARQPG